MVRSMLISKIQYSIASLIPVLTLDSADRLIPRDQDGGCTKWTSRCSHLNAGIPPDLADDDHLMQLLVSAAIPC